MDTTPLSHPSEFMKLCNDARTRVKEISTDEVKNLLDQKESFYLIDVRDRDEFDQGYITQAIPLSKSWIEAKIHNVTTEKDPLIVLYCGGGNRSILAADNLQKMGYKNVKSM